MSINVKGRNRVYSLGNLGRFIAFGALTAGIWFALGFVAGLIITQPLPSFHHVVALLLVFAFFAIAISWILVGRKIVWPEIVYIALLGPFNLWQPAHFNLRQLRIVWVSCMLLWLLLIFPPWQGYAFGSGDKGVGKPAFVGFYFFFSDDYALAETPYMFPEISWKMLGILSCCILLVAGILVYFMRSKADSSVARLASRHVKPR